MSIYGADISAPFFLHAVYARKRAEGGMDMSLIDVRNLSFYYEGTYDYIFENVNFQMDTRWRLGLVGRNGRGKTTFLNLLMGKMEYQGEIITDTLFDYFPFEVAHPKKSVMEIIEEVDENCEFWKICREMTQIGLDMEVLERSFDTLSHGEQTKVLLAILFARENYFLLIDEPTNHLDMEAREVVCDYLKEKEGFILVSHDRYFLDGCVDHILAVNRHGIEIEKGNFSSWWENRQRQDAFERAENARLEKDIRRLKMAAGQAHRWADKVESTKIGKKSMAYERNRDYVGERSRRMQQRRKNLEHRQEKEIEAKEKLLKNVETTESLFLKPLVHHKSCLAELKNLRVVYGEKEVCRNVNLKVNQGQRIALQGSNGCGKSSILKLIVGENVPHEGQVITAEGLKISYVPQDTSWLTGSLKIFAKRCELDETLFFTLLRKMDFSREQFEKPMQTYSSGQKKKVLLARSLCQQAHLYIWDEPLNYIDIFSRMQIETFIKNACPTMLIVEHDRKFLENTADLIISMDFQC